MSRVVAVAVLLLVVGTAAALYVKASLCSRRRQDRQETVDFLRDDIERRG